MWDIYKSLTVDERGVLKARLQEPDMDDLRQNPFHISDSNINVSNTFCQKVSLSCVSFCKIEKKKSLLAWLDSSESYVRNFEVFVVNILALQPLLANFMAKWKKFINEERPFLSYQEIEFIFGK